MADAPKLLGTDTLRQAYPKFNQAIDNANEALGTANTAKSTADTAKSTADTALANSENTQTQLDTIVINGDSSVEAAQARVAADGSTFTTLKERLDNRDEQLAERPTKNEVPNLYEQFIIALDFIKQDGSLVVIGDSITEGYGLPYANQYVSKLFQLLKKANGYMNDFEVITNFQAEHTIQLAGTYSIGSKGASKKSLILQPDATITFTGEVQYIDILFDKTPTSGSIEVYRDGVLYKTINTSGTADPYAHSFPSASSNYFESATYTLKCITAPVEILGLIRLESKGGGKGGINLIRAGVSGENSTYFNDSTVLDYIEHSTDFALGNPNKMYIIAIGTNDIYNSGKATTPDVYRQNLESIIGSLKSNGSDTRIVLTVPPIANEASWQAVLSQYGNYRQQVYYLADKYNLSVIDYSYIDFIGNSMYQDGVHPNDNGTTAMVEHIQKTLALGVKKELAYKKGEFPFTVQNGYSIVTGEYGTAEGTSKNDRVNLTGTLTVGTKTNGTLIGNVPSEYAPKQSLVLNIGGFDGGFNQYNVLVKFDSAGNLTLIGDLNPAIGYIGLDGISYDL